MRVRFAERWDTRAVRRSACVAAAFTALVASVPRAQAQTAGDTAAVAVAVLAHVRGELPAGRGAVDAEPFCSARLVGWRCSENVRAAVAQNDFSLNAREFTLICTGGQGSCRLVAVRSLVSFEGLEFDMRAGRARVTTNLWWRTGQGMSPVSYRQREITLTRDRQDWTVSGSGR